MHVFFRIFTAMALLVLGACTSQQEKPDQIETVKPSVEQTAMLQELEEAASNVPANTTIKQGINLNLVRALEGGACNPADQGVLATLLLYADPQAIERIKLEQGPEVFNDYTREIETMSLNAIQTAVNEAAFPEPFPAEKSADQQIIKRDISRQFRMAIESSIEAFQQDTTLTIDIIPYLYTFELFGENCNDSLMGAE